MNNLPKVVTQLFSMGIEPTIYCSVAYNYAAAATDDDDISYCLLTGNLHFVNVIPDDEKGGAQYACIAGNRVLRRDTKGEYNMITPHGGDAVSRFPLATFCSY